MVEKMSEMDPASMMNQMYYSAMRLLPIFILIIILSNSLIADQVDQGAMAFGGGLSMFFLASTIGMFGSENMLNTGMGVTELSIFNKLT